MATRFTKGSHLRVSASPAGCGAFHSETGLPFLDHMLDQLGTHGLLDLNVKVFHRPAETLVSPSAGAE
jgi:imidazoleglycerol-phosphate dehydratase